MSNKSLSSQFSDFQKIVKKKIEKDLVELNKKTLEKTFPKFVKEIDKEVKNRYELSVDKFYQSYSPLYYHRRGSLYDLLVTNYDKLKLEYSWEFDPNKILYTGSNSASYSHGEDGLYSTVFRGGYHGGAYHNGSFYWRTPYPYFTHWGQPAAYEQISILEDFQNRIHKYETGKMKKDFKRIYTESLYSLL